MSHIKSNFAGGFDLVTERDSGNQVQILTGNVECSLEFWQEMKSLAERAIDLMENPERREPSNIIIIGTYIQDGDSFVLPAKRNHGEPLDKCVHRELGEFLISQELIEPMDGTGIKDVVDVDIVINVPDGVNVNRFVYESV